MQDRALLVSMVGALAGGLAQTYLALHCWDSIGVYSPVVRWLFDFGLRTKGIYSVLYPLDPLTNVLINMPAAWVLTRLRPERVRLYLIAAVIPSFVWLNRSLANVSFPNPHAGLTAWGWLLELSSLPIAVWLVGCIRRTGGNWMVESVPGGSRRMASVNRRPFLEKGCLTKVRV